MLAMLWCDALIEFAVASTYSVALVLLFTAGFFELSFNAMRRAWCNSTRQTRSAATCSACSTWQASACTFSGVSVGLLGALIGVHWSLRPCGLVMLAIAAPLLASR
jgi:hypothetical protein